MTLKHLVSRLEYINAQKKRRALITLYRYHDATLRKTGANSPSIVTTGPHRSYEQLLELINATILNYIIVRWQPAVPAGIRHLDNKLVWFLVLSLIRNFFSSLNTKPGFNQAGIYLFGDAAEETIYIERQILSVIV